jgi:hypothetical protein
VPPITNRIVLLVLATDVDWRTAASKRGHVARLARSLEHLLRDQSHDAVKHSDWQFCGDEVVYSSTHGEHTVRSHSLKASSPAPQKTSEQSPPSLPNHESKGSAGPFYLARQPV